MIFEQLLLNWFLYFFAVLGILSNRHNFLLILICFEILLLSVNLNFVLGSVYLDDFYGQVFAIFITTIAGTESAIGLSILVTYFRSKGAISLTKNMNLKK